MLDSANAFLGEAQITWFEEQLASAKSQVFIFTHTNPFADQTFDVEQDQFTSTLERAWFISTLNSACKAFFSGHIHKRVINTIRNVQIITLEDFIGHKTFCRVHVSPAGISWNFETL
jgi:gamma-glutamyltranspeptidase